MQRHHRHRCSTAAISTTAVVTVSLLVVLLLTGPAAAADAPEGAAAPALQNAVLQNSRVQAAPADAAATPPADAATGAAAATNGNGNSGDNGLELEPANGYTNGYGYGRRPECRAAEFTLASAGAKPAAPVAADAYSEAGVAQHLAVATLSDFRAHAATTLACVDSRSEQPLLGTPGGDAAEFTAAAAVYFKLTGEEPTDAAVADALTAFLAAPGSPISPARPFYFHTSEDKLAAVFEGVAAAGVAPPPVVLPRVAPANATEREAWLEQLSKGKHQGCGHMRLMIDRFADYGLDSPRVPRAVVRALYAFWWPAPLGARERALVDFEVLQGPLNGHAVEIVESEGCPGASPAVPAARGGSQSFVYHPQAAQDWRDGVLAPFFERHAAARGARLDGARFRAELKSLQAKQLAATLTHLAPANALPQWVVKVRATAQQT